MPSNPTPEQIEKLQTLIREWRDTANVWTLQLQGGPTPAGDPPQRGAGAIRNWINWLRAHANAVEDILENRR